ncbi:MAG: potassium channel family protein [Steroidobacteraceae bacterium]
MRDELESLELHRLAFDEFAFGALLLILNVAFHAVVLSWAFRFFRLEQADHLLARRHLAAEAWLLARLALIVVLAHMIEIAMWGLFYLTQGVMPTLSLSLYFSAVTYATIGYGDVVPPSEWRLVASMEGLTGILMCAWSGGFFFAVAARLQGLHREAARPGQGQSVPGDSPRAAPHPEAHPQARAARR